MTKEKAISYLGMAVPITALTMERFAEFDEAIHMAVQALVAEPKTGKWEIYVISMFDGEGCKCSECGFEGVPYWDYCPNCGSYNGGENEV